MSKLHPYPLGENDKELYQLNTPVSRCLKLLIEKHGEVVAQEEFFDYVWKQHGYVVSVNSFYQNISLLRKAIKKAGIDDDIIITVPKKGIMLPKRFSIEPVKVDVSQAINQSHLPSEKPLDKKKEIKSKILFCAIILASISILALTFNINSNNDYAAEYTKSDITQDNCIFFFNNDATNYSNHVAFLKSRKIDCSLNKFIYVKTYSDIDRVSVFQCTNEMKSNTVKNFCTSEYYLLWKEK
jgi:DNA-binding winged helix-turn-helix (wHTH) protein